MIIVSKWWRRLELTLWAVGLALLAVVSDTALERWTYQAQQERALFQRGPAVSVSAHQRPDVEPQRSTSVQADKAAAEEITRTVKAQDDGPIVPAVARREEAKPRAVADEPTALGRLEIPRLGLAAIVADSDDEATLARAVGRVPGSALPGQPGNMVFAGHRDTFFRPLRNIEVNDSIRFVAPNQTYEYRVRSLRVVEPEETSVLASNGTEELTLVTCYPFTFIGAAPERFVVVATRVN